jgi:solute carrier family 10 (sodium/bile acid cotransporter), member 7
MGKSSNTNTFLHCGTLYTSYYSNKKVLAGLGLKTEEFSNALRQFKFNVLVQVFNFFVVSSIVFGVSRGLLAVGAFSQGLAAGLIICASLPVTINMVLVLTKSSGGDEAAAIFNAAFGNMIGVFLSPVLILGYLGVTSDLNLFDVFYKLVLRVVVPVVVGQILQKTSKTVMDFTKAYKQHFKAAQQYALVFIVYAVFCKTFSEDGESNIKDIFIMIVVQFLLLCSLKILAWGLLKIVFPQEPKLRVAGLFICTHKTVSRGRA